MYRVARCFGTDHTYTASVLATLHFSGERRKICTFHIEGSESAQQLNMTSMEGQTNLVEGSGCFSVVKVEEKLDAEDSVVELEAPISVWLLPVSMARANAERKHISVARTN